jgi:hypothetical protein
LKLRKAPVDLPQQGLALLVQPTLDQIEAFTTTVHVEI